MVELVNVENILFQYDEFCRKLLPTLFNPKNPCFFFYHEEMSKGLTETDSTKSCTVNGYNSLEVPITPIWLLFIEVPHPFTVF